MSDKNTEQMRFEGIGQGSRDTDCITECPLREGGGVGGGDASDESREHQSGNSSGDKADRQDPHEL